MAILLCSSFFVHGQTTIKGKYKGTYPDNCAFQAYHNYLGDQLIWHRFQITDGLFSCTVESKQPMIEIFQSYIYMAGNDTIDLEVDSLNNLKFKNDPTNTTLEKLNETFVSLLNKAFNSGFSIFFNNEDAPWLNTIDSLLNTVADDKVRKLFTEYSHIRLSHICLCAAFTETQNYNAAKIEKYFRPADSLLWLQLQQGRIALRNYYLEYLPKKKGISAEMSFKSEAFQKLSQIIKNYIRYQYLAAELQNNKKLNSFHEQVFTELRLACSGKELTMIDDLHTSFRSLQDNFWTSNDSVQLTDLNNRVYSIRELGSKDSVTIYFWATWCQPCVAFLEKYNKNKDQYPKTIFISIDKDDEKWRRFCQKLNNDTPRNFYRIDPIKYEGFLKQLKIESVPRAIKVYSDHIFCFNCKI
jgi:thiol-disulfide isomerase/thioredoxin